MANDVVALGLRRSLDILRANLFEEKKSFGVSGEIEMET